MKPTIALDLETTFSIINKYGGKKPKSDKGDPFNPDNKVVLVGCMDVSTGIYQSFDMRKPGRLKALKNLVYRYQVMVGHNIKFDTHWLENIGVDTSRFILRDTFLIEYIKLASNHNKYGLGLAKVAPRYGGSSKMDIVVSFWNTGVNTDEIPTFILAEYLYYDLLNTTKVYVGQLKDIDVKRQGTYLKFYHEVLQVVAKMERTGAKYNETAKAGVLKSIEQDLTRASMTLYDIVEKVASKSDGELSEVNLNSSDQMFKLIYSLKLKQDDESKAKWKAFTGYFKPWAKGAQRQLDRALLGSFDVLPYGLKLKPSVSFLDDKKAYGVKGLTTGSKYLEKAVNSVKLNKTQEKFLIALQEHSKAETWKSSNFTGVMNGVRQDGYIHGSFNMGRTSTRRFSSSEPNMQNWPREGTNPLKKLITSRYDGGYIVSADYAQLEFRVVGMLADEQTLIKDVTDDFDIHSHTAKMAFGEKFTEADKPQRKKLRQDAKASTFAFQYGAVPKNKNQQAIFDAFYGKYSNIAAWQDMVVAEVSREAEYVCPYTGVVFKFEGATWDNLYMWITKAKNYPVQFLGDAITKCALVSIDEQLPEGADIILTVHDNIIVDCKPELADQVANIIRDEMEGVSKTFYRYFKKTLDIPLVVDVSYGSTWFDQEEYNFNTNKEILNGRG